MTTRTTLTKSLHTVTVVSRVALMQDNNGNQTDVQLVREALGLLGLNPGWPESDPTFAACVAKVRAMRGAK